INRLKRFVAAGSTASPDRYLAYLSRLGDGFRGDVYAQGLRSEISGAAGLRRFRQLYAAGGAPSGLRAGLYLDYKTFLPDDILALSDRLAMAHSLEVRVPFVDHVLVEQAFALPDRTKIGWWQNKHLLKRALRSRLPQEHFRAPKRGFVGPTSAWLRHELREMVQDELSAERMGRLGFFSPAAVLRLVDDHVSRRQNREGILWGLLSFSTWHRLYAERPPSQPYPGSLRD
ncbi:MAG: asparagine synthase-related protein, partial [Acidimicrobiales bacterium]